MNMEAITVQNREIGGRKREIRPHDYGMANAAARKVRRDWPSNTIEATAGAFGLTYGEAKGVVYGTASRTTLDKMLKQGGWGLVVELAADLLGQPLEQFIEQQAREAAHERARWEAKERSLVSLEAKLRARGPEPCRLDGRDA